MTTESASALAGAVALVGDRWTLLVVESLLAGSRRFNELSEQIEGIAPNILAARLKRLEQDGIVVARPYSRRPPRVAYGLTGRGQDLAGALRLLAQWGSAHSAGTDVPRHETCGTPIEPHWYCPTCSRVVDEAEEPEVRYV